MSFFNSIKNSFRNRKSKAVISPEANSKKESSVRASMSKLSKKFKKTHSFFSRRRRLAVERQFSGRASLLVEYPDRMERVYNKFGELTGTRFIPAMRTKLAKNFALNLYRNKVVRIIQ